MVGAESATRLVAVLGASDKPDRYAYKALKLLQEHGFPVAPIHPRLAAVDGIPVVASIADVDGAIDTVTVYLRPELASPLVEAIVTASPRRVIFNPGTESEAMSAALASAGIEVEEACTLVLLGTGQF